MSKPARPADVLRAPSCALVADAVRALDDNVRAGRSGAAILTGEPTMSVSIVRNDAAAAFTLGEGVFAMSFPYAHVLDYKERAADAKKSGKRADREYAERLAVVFAEAVKDDADLMADMRAAIKRDGENTSAERVVRKAREAGVLVVDGDGATATDDADGVSILRADAHDGVREIVRICLAAGVKSFAMGGGVKIVLAD